MPKLFVTPKKNSRKTWIIAAVVFVLLAAVAGGYYYWSTTQKSTVSEDPSIKKLNNTELANEYNKLMSDKNYDQAQKLIEYQDDNDGDTSKVILLADVSAKKGDTTAAIKILTDASAKDPENAYYYKGYEARYLASSGDKQGALAAYQEALDLAAKVKPEGDAETLAVEQEIGDYQWEISQLNKGAQ